MPEHGRDPPVLPTEIEILVLALSSVLLVEAIWLVRDDVRVDGVVNRLSVAGADILAVPFGRRVRVVAAVTLMAMLLAALSILLQAADMALVAAVWVRL